VLVVVSTGQHRKLLKGLEKCFGLEPDLDLELMLTGQELSDLFERAIPAITQPLDRVSPTLLISARRHHHGDGWGSSCFSSRCSCCARRIWAENGRFERAVPRGVQPKSNLSHLHFMLCAYLDGKGFFFLMEGVPEERIFQVGNTVVTNFSRRASKCLLKLNETMVFCFGIF